MSARRGRWSGVVLSALCFAALACSGGDGRSAATGDTGASASGAAGGARKAIKIAMIAKSSDNPVFLAARTGAEAAAKELSTKGGVPIEVEWLTPPKEDGEVQAQRVMVPGI